MDDYDGASYYKAELAKLINEIQDLDILDLIYKILVEARA